MFIKHTTDPFSNEVMITGNSILQSLTSLSQALYLQIALAVYLIGVKQGMRTKLLLLPFVALLKSAVKMH